MVGLEVAKLIDYEHKYTLSLAPNFHQLLRHYQAYIIEHDPELASFLAPEAKRTAEAILEIDKSRDWKRVSVLGKVAANDQGLNHEGDLILESDQSTLPISLKVARKGSFLNTKSAGIRSCLTKYFSASDEQEQLNQIQEMEFAKLSRSLEELNGLNPTSDFSSWKQAGLDELPGSLKDEARVLLNDYYARLLASFSKSVEQIRETSPDKFIQATKSLSGFAHAEVIQVVMFYDRDQQGNYRSGDIATYTTPHFKQLPQIRFDGGNTSLYIQNDEFRLQLRIKPMNVFTTKAIKINSSMRHFLPQV